MKGSEQNDLTVSERTGTPAPPSLRPYWLSWTGDIGNFALHSPWWVSGETPDGAFTICAAVMAATTGDAKEVVHASHDYPSQYINWRFVMGKENGWSPFCDRFPRADWMQWPTIDGAERVHAQAPTTPGSEQKDPSLTLEEKA